MSTPSSPSSPSSSPTPLFRSQRTLSSPFSNRSLEEIERLLYIEGNPFHEVLSLRGPAVDRAAYDANMKTMKSFVETLGRDLCLSEAEISAALPVLLEVPNEDQPDLF